MHLDALLPYDSQLADIPEVARAAEEMGFSSVWVAETQHNPFLPCALIAEHTEALGFGTAIAVSFARSPEVMAMAAWDLAAYAGGRFRLGLGTQVRAHIERRFGMDWPDSPVGKLREQISVLRAFWAAWQQGERLNVRGEYYQLTLMSPFFAPPPIEQPEIPIYIAGVNTAMASLAGEAADGFLVHPFHSPEYLREVLLPAIRRGAEGAGREVSDIEIVLNAFVATNAEEREFARQQLAFYASTPSYRRVLTQHGFEAVGEELSKLASRKRWGEMPALVSNEMLGTFATLAEEADMAEALKAGYEGIGDRLALYIPFVPGARDEFWKRLVVAFNQG